MLEGYTNGLLMGLSLIVAIGAQNAYVLRQAIRREHHWLIAAICSLSDLGLILLGVMGLGALVEASPRVETAFYFFGALFLAQHAYRAGRDALLANQALTIDTGSQTAPRRGIVLNTLALSWLNPHAWLDTAVLLGTFALHYAGPARIAFTGGAVTASVSWFFGVTLLTALLSRWLTRPRVWRMINLGIAAVMLYVTWIFLDAGMALLRG